MQTITFITLASRLGFAALVENIRQNLIVAAHENHVTE
jgi:hypothetical protein